MTALAEMFFFQTFETLMRVVVYIYLYLYLYIIYTCTCILVLYVIALSTYPHRTYLSTTRILLRIYGNDFSVFRMVFLRNVLEVSPMAFRPSGVKGVE